MLSTKQPGKKSRPSIGALLLEVSLIILGVMVALAANEWRESRATANRTEVALENIRLEIVRNQKAIADRLPYHEALRDSIRTYLPELENLSFQEIDRNRLGMQQGLRFLLLYNAAWQTALTSQTLPHVEYETLTILSTIYQVQDNLRDIELRLMGLLFAPDNFKAGNLYYAALSAMPLLNDVIGLESGLEALYDKALQRLGPDEIAM